jgi:uncharacterized membrane-anchored protein YjiN (DUF445 family)
MWQALDFNGKVGKIGQLRHVSIDRACMTRLCQTNLERITERKNNGVTRFVGFTLTPWKMIEMSRFIPLVFGS